MGDFNSNTSCRFKDGGAFYNADLFAVDLQSDLIHRSSPVARVTPLSVAGRGGGIGSPESTLTALKRGGQTLRQVPHLVHFF